MSQFGSLFTTTPALRTYWFLVIPFCASLLQNDRANAQQFRFQPPDPASEVSLVADSITSWQQGESEVLLLEGNAELQQDAVHVTAERAIIWIYSSEEDPELKKLVTWCEGNQVIVRLNRNSDPHLQTGHAEDAIVDSVWLGEFYTVKAISSNAPANPLTGDLPDAYNRAVKYRESQSNSEIRPVTFFQQSDTPQLVVNPQTGQVQQITPPTVPDLNIREPEIPPTIPDSSLEQGELFSTPSTATPTPISTSPSPASGALQAGRGGAQVLITARDPTVNLDLGFAPNPANPNERVITASGGVRVTITSPDISQIDAFRTDAEKQVVILADNVVAWQSPLGDGTDRWEMYLEGNVIFAKDRRIIYADQMYYDANFQQGTILNADVYTPIQNFAGLARMKAGVIQQVDANNMTAYGAAFTTSRLAVPRYWLQSNSIDINRVQNLQADLQTGEALFDQNSGLPKTEDEYFATSRKNRIYAAGVPVFGWPRFRTSLNDPALYLRSLRLGNDDVFGFQLLTSWDLYQLLGIRNKPQGTELLGSLDYLSERGIAFGTESKYSRNSFLGIPGPVRGVYKSWFINDGGLDNLGRERSMLIPEEELRGRILWNHFQQFAPGYNFRAELGYISDRNFLESFYEREWDTAKDAITGFWLERNIGTESYNLATNLRINDSFTQTSWLPRFDHFSLGRSLFTNRPIVHHSHSHIGYGRLRVAEPPSDPAEIFNPLAWEADVDGIRTGTRQQLDFPRQLGAVKVVPYVLGDLTYWQEDLNGDDALRAYGQVGIRASLPFWKVDPTIQSLLWNVNGLAHKLSFDIEAFYADSSQDLSRFALYDQLDDDSQEAFRRRYPFNTFGIPAGGDIPLRFDERYFALRSGFQSDVTASSLEIADDLAIIRGGVRQRWQTKRGLPGQERIIDWITFDVSTALFPKADRDNFGSDFGQFDYDFKWHIGDRVSLVSDGYLDFFGQGLRTVSAGIQTNRPGVGDAYLGIRSIEGPISSNVLSASATYRMSEKWGVRANSQVDFGDTGAIGNALSFIYIGESFLWQFGVNADFSRSNVGFRFGLEPRFIKRGRIFRPGQQAITPASSNYLE